MTGDQVPGDGDGRWDRCPIQLHFIIIKLCQLLAGDPAGSPGATTTPPWPGRRWRATNGAGWWRATIRWGRVMGDPGCQDDDGRGDRRARA